MKKLSIFMLAMIALLCLLPFIGGCQEFDSKSWSDYASSKPERPEWLISTDSIPIDSISSGCASTSPIARIRPAKTKADTISVALLCQQYTKSSPDSPINWTSGEVRVEYKMQERQLELREKGQPYPAGDGFGYYRWTLDSQWVVKSTRWLYPISGCYQLIPLKE